MTPAISANPVKGQSTPAVTLTILVANLAVAFGSLVVPSLTLQLAFDPANPTPWTAFSSLFTHGNLIHLLGNLVFLAAVGTLIEFSRGRKKFILIYFASGLVGVLAYMGWAALLKVEAVPLVGASGAVAGCLGYASVLFFGKKVPLAPNISAPVWLVALIWIALQAIGVLAHSETTQPATAFSTHVGGFLVGLMLSLIFGIPKTQSRQLGHEVLNQLNSNDPHVVLGVADKHLKAHPGDSRAMIEKATALITLGRRDQAYQVIQPLLASVNQEARIDSSRFLIRHGMLHRVHPTQRLKTAESIEDQDIEAATILIESVLTEPDHESERAFALYKLAVVLRDVDPDRSATLVAELRAKYPLHHAVSLADSAKLE